MGQHIAGHIVKSLVVHLFDRYEVRVMEGHQEGNSYDVDKSSWTPKADAELQLTTREGSLS